MKIQFAMRLILSYEDESDINELKGAFDERWEDMDPEDEDDKTSVNSDELSIVEDDVIVDYVTDDIEDEVIDALRTEVVEKWAEEKRTFNVDQEVVLWATGSFKTSQDPTTLKTLDDMKVTIDLITWDTRDLL